MSISLPDVAISRDGRRAVEVIQASQRFEALSDRVDSYQIRAYVRLKPHAPPSWIRVVVNGMEIATDSNPAQIAPRLRLGEGLDALGKLCKTWRPGWR